MIDPRPVLQDPARLAALRDTGLMDSPAEPAFDRLTRLATRLLGVPVGLVTLVDADRQFFKSQQGLPEPWAARRETPLSHSFCQYVVGSGQPLVVGDARIHQMLCTNRAIPELDVLAYLGVPLATRDGQVLGAFCAIDDRPRRWDPADLEALADLAAGAAAEIELRAELAARQRVEEELRRTGAYFQALAESSSDLVCVLDGASHLRYVSPAVRHVLGHEPGPDGEHDLVEWLHPDDRAATVDVLTGLLREPGGSRVFEARVRHADGSWRLLEALARNLLHDPVVAGVVVNTRDVTARREAEAALAASRARMTRIAENVPGMVYQYALHPDGRVTFPFVSDGSHAICGLVPEEIMADAGAALALVHPEDLPGFGESVAASAATLQPWRWLGRLCRRDGGTRWVQAAARPERQGDGTVLWDGVILDVTELQRTSAELRQSREHYRVLFEAAPVGIVSVDADGRFLQVSPAFCAMVGRTADELRGMPFADLTLEEDNPLNARLFAELVTGERERYQMEKRYRHADGRIIWVNLTAAAVRDEAGRMLCTVAMIKDITERRAAADALRAAHDELEARVRERTAELDRANATLLESREALRQSVSDYRGLFENAHDAIVLLDPDTEEVLDVNARACEMYRIARSDFLGLSMSLLSRDADLGRARVRETVERASTHHFETTQLRGDGEEMFLEVNASVVEYRQRRAILSINRDITGRKRVEEALRESEAQLRAVFEATAAGIALVDRAGRPVETNRALREMLRLSAAEIRARTLHDLSHPEDAAAEAARLGELMEGRRTHYHAEQRFVRGDGGTLWGRLTVSAVRDEAGEPEYAIAVVDDVTERMRLEAELRQSQKMEAVGRLAGGIAHDFNNLLMSIMAHTYVLLRDGAVDAAARWSAEEIQRSSERAAALTRQLLAFSRKQVLQPTTLSLGEVTAGMEELLRRLIGEDVEFRVQTDRSAARVRADRSQLEQVVMNLVVNARDAMPDGGRVTVRTSTVRLERPWERDGATLPPGDYAVLSVADNGHGMDAETRARIFEPFFTTKEMGKGTGLGLSTVYGIAKQSGGWIWVESQPGEGAVFELYLPLAEGAADVPPAPTPPIVRGRETLLLVEDDEGVRVPLRRILEGSGYTVLEAADGQAGLEAAARAAVDLVLCDVVMPRMGGPEMVRRLRGERPDVRVLLMSGYTDEAVARQGEREAGVPFIQKPVHPDELVRRVREVLDAGAAAPAAG